MRIYYIFRNWANHCHPSMIVNIFVAVIGEEGGRRSNCIIITVTAIITKKRSEKPMHGIRVCPDQTIVETGMYTTTVRRVLPVQ